MALIGTISGSNGTSTTAISGSLIIADSPASSFPTLQGNVKFLVSGTKNAARIDDPQFVFDVDVFHSGAIGSNQFVQFKPVDFLQIPTNTTASYIYTSGSTNDLYFTQYNGPYTNTTRFRWLESIVATGLLHGGTVSTVNGTTTFSVLSGSGIIVTQNATITTDPFPTIANVRWANVVSQSLTYAATDQITYLYVDSSGAINQTPNPLSIAQKASSIYLGRVLHQTGGVTNGTITEPAIAYGLGESSLNFQRAFGPLKISGHVLSATASNGGTRTLGLNKTTGDSYVEGRNYTINPNSPNLILAANDPALTGSKIFREYTDSAGDPVILTNGGVGFEEIDPSTYNNNGATGSVNNSEWTNQRVFWYPNSVNRALYVYYGPQKYVTFDDAIGGISTETFAEGPNTAGSAVLVGVITVNGNATDLTAATTTRVTQAGLFRGAGFGAGGGGSTSPGGSDTYVQFNDSSGFGGDAGFTYNKTTDSITVAGNITGSNTLLSGDLAVNGGDITSSATIFNFIPSGSTGNTLNIGETTGVVQIGKATGPTTVRLAYGNTTSPSVKTVEIGTNGQSGSTTNITIGSTAGSGRTTFNNDVALTTGNIIGAPGAGANVMTLVSSGNIIAKLDTDNSASGHKFAVQNYSNVDQFSVTETGDAEIANTLYVTGSSKFQTGLSGSLTNLTDGSSYIKRLNSSVLITSQSNGSITFSSDPQFGFLNRRLLIAQVEDSNTSGFFGVFPYDIATQVTNTSAVMGNTDAIMAFTSLATANSCAAFRTNNTWARIGHTGRMRARLLTGADITSQTITFGLGTGTSTTGAGNSYSYSPAESQILAVYDSATSGNWLLLTKDGTTANTANTGVAVAINTEYYIDINFTASSVTLSINGSTPVSSSTNLPAAGTTMYTRMGINPTTNSSRVMYVSRAVYEAGQISAF